MKSGISIKKDRLQNVMKAIATLPEQDLLVGIPADGGSGVVAAHDGQNTRTDQGSRASGITNAELGYIHENGAPERNIPARPTLMPGVRAAKSVVQKYFGLAGKAALSGNKERVARELARAGFAAVRHIQSRITNGPYAPLAESTLAARRRRGVARTKPLIDTGQFRRSFTFVVRKRSKRAAA